MKENIENKKLFNEVSLLKHYIAYAWFPGLASIRDKKMYPVKHYV
jgi:hypothetical protein